MKTYEETISWMAKEYFKNDSWPKVREFLPVIGYIYDRNSNEVLSDVKSVIRHSMLEK